MYNRIKKITAFALLVCMLATNFWCVSADNSELTFENASETDGVFTLNGMVVEDDDIIELGDLSTKYFCSFFKNIHHCFRHKEKENKQGNSNCK